MLTTLGQQELAIFAFEDERAAARRGVQVCVRDVGGGGLDVGEWRCEDRWAGVQSTFSGVPPVGVVLVMDHHRDGVVQRMWSEADVDELFAIEGTQNWHYVFLSYGNAYVNDTVVPERGYVDRVEAVRKRFVKAGVKDKVHFVAQNPLAVPGWLSQRLLANTHWGVSVVGLTAQVAGSQLTIPLTPPDSKSKYPRSIFSPRNGTSWGLPSTSIVVAGKACSYSAGMRSTLEGYVALVDRGSCPFTEKLSNVMRAGAVAMLVVTSKTKPVVPMDVQCKAPHCTPETAIPAAMMAYEDGLALKKSPAERLALDVRHRARGPRAIVIDPLGRARRVGRLGEASFLFLALESLYYNYRWDMDERDAADRKQYNASMIEVPVFTPEQGVFRKNRIVEVLFPPADVMAQFDTMEVRAQLRCPLGRFEKCGEWDRVVTMSRLADTGDQVLRAYMLNGNRTDDGLTDSIVSEAAVFAKFISGYRSGGAWVTRNSPLLPLVARGGPISFRMSTQSVAYELDVTIRLFCQHRELSATGRRHYVSPLPATAQLRHRHKLWPLFEGGKFNPSYNDGKHKSIAVPLELPQVSGRYEGLPPPVLSRIVITAYIVGRGWGANEENCAEFCNTQHIFSANDGRFRYAIDFPEAGTEFGCSRKIRKGVTPSQSGSYMSGRAGWCPGLNVDAHEIELDVTHDVHRMLQKGASGLCEAPFQDCTRPPDLKLQVKYRGLYDRRTYHPSKASNAPRNAFDAQIELNSYLTAHYVQIQNSSALFWDSSASHATVDSHDHDDPSGSVIPVGWVVLMVIVSLICVVRLARGTGIVDSWRNWRARRAQRAVQSPGGHVPLAQVSDDEQAGF